MKKAEVNFPFLKIAIHGNTGSGKTCTALKIADYLAKKAGKRIGVIDTDPQAMSSMYAGQFDFDLAHPTTIEEFEKEVLEFDTTKYAVIVVDTITWFWRCFTDAQDVHGISVDKTSAGTTQFREWGRLKKIYRDTLLRLVNLPCHTIITGRETIEYDMTSGEYSPVGYKMMAEKETPYELNLTMRCYLGRELGSKLEKSGKDITRGNFCEVIRDRSNTFQPGHTFVNMEGKDLDPVIVKLGGQVISEPLPTEQAVKNQEIFNRDRQALVELTETSAKLRLTYEQRILNAKTEKDLKALGAEIKEGKAKFTDEDLESLRGKAKEKAQALKGV